MRRRQHPGRPVQRRPAIPVFAQFHVAGVEGDAHSHRPNPLRPRLRGQRPLRRHRARQRIPRAGEGHQEGIARFFRLVPPVPAERAPQQPVVRRQRLFEGIAVLLPQGGRALDVGEEEGDGAGGGEGVKG